MPFKWSNDLSIQLIESYKTFECLWNPTHMKYKCRNEKHDAWTKLCETTGARQLFALTIGRLSSRRSKALIRHTDSSLEDLVAPKMYVSFFFYSK
jgi:hypothetical protein